MSLEQVQAWIADQQSRLDDTGIKDLRLMVGTNVCVLNGWNGWKFESDAGDSIEQAYARLRHKIPLPMDLAAQKREQAKKLLREANELEARHAL